MHRRQGSRAGRSRRRFMHTARIHCPERPREASARFSSDGQIPPSRPQRRHLTGRGSRALSVTVNGRRRSSASTLGKRLEWEAQCRFIASRRPSYADQLPVDARLTDWAGTARQDRGDRSDRSRRVPHVSMSPAISVAVRRSHQSSGPVQRLSSSLSSIGVGEVTFWSGSQMEHPA